MLRSSKHHRPSWTIPAILCFLSVVLTGCSTIPKEMTGQFNARHDSLVVGKDGVVSWSPVAKNDDHLQFVGIGAVDSSNGRQLQVTVPSTSRVRPTLLYSDDYSRVTVTWHELADGAASGRSSEYERAERK